jgi:hypothetical protein
VPASVDRRDPLISPLFANLRGFPPVLIQVGSAETLLSDATRLAEAAGSADVDVTLEIWPIHVAGLERRARERAPRLGEGGRVHSCPRALTFSHCESRNFGGILPKIVHCSGESRV